MRKKRLKILKNVLNKSGLDLFFTPTFMWTLFISLKTLYSLNPDRYGISILLLAKDSFPLW